MRVVGVFIGIAVCWLGTAVPVWAQPPMGLGRTAAPLDADSQETGEDTGDPYAAAEPDTIYLTNGSTVEGLVRETTASHVEFVREMGRGKFTTLTIPKTTVERIAYAPADARKAMQARIRWWEEKDRNDALERASYDVVKSEHWAGLWEGTGPYVRIFTDVDRSTAREMTWRANSMWGQWLTLFDAEQADGPPTQLFVLQSQVELVAVLKAVGVAPSQAIMIAGFYSPQADKAVVPLRLLTSEIYEQRIADAERRYGARLDPVNLAYHKQRLKTQMATERAMQTTTVYHETMHAFMQKVLFPGREQLPTWLNEGMASYVERVREDENGMRTEAYNPERLPIAKLLNSRGALPPIRAVVAREESITEHDTAQSAEAFYAASWALVYYLNTERDGLATDMYVQYVADLRNGADPLTAFERMTAEPVERTEAAWHQAIRLWD